MAVEKKFALRLGGAGLWREARREPGGVAQERVPERKDGVRGEP